MTFLSFSSLHVRFSFTILMFGVRNLQLTDWPKAPWTPTSLSLTSTRQWLVWLPGSWVQTRLGTLYSWGLRPTCWPTMFTITQTSFTGRWVEARGRRDGMWATKFNSVSVSMCLGDGWGQRHRFGETRQHPFSAGDHWWELCLTGFWPRRQRPILDSKIWLRRCHLKGGCCCLTFCKHWLHFHDHSLLSCVCFFSGDGG